MMLHTAHCLLPLSGRDDGAGKTLVYLDNGGLSDGSSWRRRVRRRIGALAYGWFGRPRF